MKADLQEEKWNNTNGEKRSYRCQLDFRICGIIPLPIFCIANQPPFQKYIAYKTISYHMHKYVINIVHANYIKWFYCYCLWPVGFKIDLFIFILLRIEDEFKLDLMSIFFSNNNHGLCNFAAKGTSKILRKVFRFL